MILQGSLNMWNIEKYRWKTQNSESFLIGLVQYIWRRGLDNSGMLASAHSHHLNMCLQIRIVLLCTFGFKGGDLTGANSWKKLWFSPCFPPKSDAWCDSVMVNAWAALVMSSKALVTEYSDCFSKFSRTLQGDEMTNWHSQIWEKFHDQNNESSSPICFVNPHSFLLTSTIISHWIISLAKGENKKYQKNSPPIVILIVGLFPYWIFPQPTCLSIFFPQPGGSWQQGRQGIDLKCHTGHLQSITLSRLVLLPGPKGWSLWFTSPKFSFFGQPGGPMFK